MAPHFWATEEQLTFLRSQLHEFLEKQKAKKLALFWPSLHRDWFSRWPASDPDIPLPVDKEQLDAYQQAEGEIISRQKKVRRTCHPSIFVIKLYQRLKDWFNNNNIKKKLRNTRPSCKPFQIQMKQHRRPQCLEIYSRQYYDERVRHKVQAEIKDKGLTRKEVLSTIKRLTAEAFEAEPAELKEKIYAEAEAFKGVKKTDELESEKDRTPESYAEYVQDYKQPYYKL
jgi:hypothetical protein